MWFGTGDALLPGHPFPEITVYNINQVKTKIKFEEKNVYLVDYWASWCGPCIDNLPVLKGFEKKYKNKSFKIISISIDNNYQNWVNAIKKHGVYWDNFCNMSGFNSADVRTFAIYGIPFMILVDKKGQIVKVNPSNKEVENYLAEL
jgi:thiol-disulfide isomerase/thioredoxin